MTEPPSRPSSGQKVIVVNDDRVQLSILSGLAKQQGLEVRSYESPIQALEAMRQEKTPDLIVTDLHMPEMDGWRFCRLLRSPEYSIFNSIPILVVSATYSGDDTRRITTELGANAFLPVPVKAVQFNAVIQELLRGKTPASKPVMLLVEDDQAAAALLKTVFIQHGYEVAVAFTGEEALEMFPALMPEIALLDYHLPDMDGDQLIAEFTRMNSATALIMMTADSRPELALKWMQSGARAYARKPFEPGYIIALCESVRREKALLHVEDLLEKRTHELQESDARFRLLIERAPIGILIGRDGKVIFANQSLLEMYGYSGSQELEDAATHKLMGSPAQPDTGQPSNSPKSMTGFHEGVGQRKNGSKIIFHVNNSIMDLPDGPASIAFVSDVTERKRVENERAQFEDQFRQAQKMEAMGRLASGVAHDFNNLLTAFKGYIAMALMDLDPSNSLYSKLSEMDHITDRAAGLTRQLLAFSRKQIIEPKVVCLDDVIENTRKLLIRLIGEDITLFFRPEQAGTKVKIDPGQMDQILVNLAVNARDAMPDGGTLIIETQTVDLDAAFCLFHPEIKPGQYILISVSDTGCGMVDEVKQHLFEPFFTTKPTGKGTGLGLATVYGAVCQNRGIILVESEPEKGTQFKIYFPTWTQTTESAAQRAAIADFKKGTETILLVEDDPSVRVMVEQMLARWGYEVLACSNGADAIRLANRHGAKIHILLADVIMPGMNGKELAERLCRKYPHLKVLFTSGYTADILAPHGVMEEGVHFLPKPYTMELLAHKVREVADLMP